MAKETPSSELRRLRKEQDKTRQDEVFGGLSHGEWAEYDLKSERIHQLEREIRARAAADEIFKSAKANQRVEWNKRADTDTPQVEARQPYRSRERDFTQNSTARVKGSSVKNEVREWWEIVSEIIHEPNTGKMALLLKELDRASVELQESEIVIRRYAKEATENSRNTRIKLQTRPKDQPSRTQFTSVRSEDECNRDFSTVGGIHQPTMSLRK